MFLGIDLDKVDVVIFLRPYNQPAALIQGGGRGGRKRGNGKRSTVQVYQFFNSQDLTASNKLMSPVMRELCLSSKCTRQMLRSIFVGNSEGQEETTVDEEHCCHNCDERLSVN